MDSNTEKDVLVRIEAALAEQERSISFQESKFVETEKSAAQAKELLSLASKLSQDLEVTQKRANELTENYRGVKAELRRLEDDKAETLRSLDKSAMDTTEKSFLESQLRTDIVNLKKEFTHAREEYQSLQVDMEDCQLLLAATKKAIMEIDSDIKSTSSELNSIDHEPEAIAKQNEALQKQLQAMEMDLKAKNEISDKIGSDLQKSSEKLQSMTEQANQLKQDIEERSLDVNMLERQIEISTKEREMNKHQQLSLREDRIRLDASLKAGLMKIIQCNDIMNRLTRDKEGIIKGSHRADGILSNVRSFIPSLKQAVSGMQNDLKNLDSEYSDLNVERQKFRRAIDFALLGCLNSESMEAKQEQALKDSLLNSIKAQNQLEECKHCLKELMNCARKLKVERNAKEADSEKLQYKLENLRNEIREKTHARELAKTRLQELARKSSNLDSLVVSVKDEKNKYLALIQVARQVIQELKDKLELVENEQQLKSKLAEEKQLELEQGQETLNILIQEKAKIRHEMNLVFTDFRKLNHNMDQDDISIKNLQIRMYHLVSNMERVRQSFDLASKLREKNAKILLERNDDICILYEKLTTLERRVREFDNALVEHEQNVKSYRHIHSDLKRQTSQLRKTIESRETLYHKWKELKNELEKAVEDEKQYHNVFDTLFQTENTKSLRVLAGKDKSIDELKRLIKIGEKRLLQQESIYMDRERTLENMAQEIQQIHEQIRDHKEINGDFNIYHWKKIDSDFDIKIVAAISEAGMNQSIAADLKQQLQTMEIQYKELLKKLEITSKDLSHLEKQTKLNDNSAIARQLLEQLGLESESVEYKFDAIGSNKLKFKLDDGRWTTAAPRPVLGENRPDQMIFPVQKPGAVLKHRD